MNQLFVRTWDLGLICSSDYVSIEAVLAASGWSDPFNDLFGLYQIERDMQDAYEHYDPNAAGFPLGVVKDHRPGSGARP